MGLSQVESQSILFRYVGTKIFTRRITDHSGNPLFAVQAHDGDVNGIAIGEQKNLNIVACCGRDRTIQVFHRQNGEMDLLQTLADHAASVTDLMFTDGTTYLMSISSDRTVSIRKMACGAEGPQAYISIRTISLKSSPVSFTRVPDDPNSIVVSTMDRQIQRYGISGRLLHSFKISDSAINETVIMSSLELHNIDETEKRTQILIGVSSTDKSIRFHEYDSGSLLIREHGQSGISAISLIWGPMDSDARQKCLVSCGHDGTVMMWDLYLPNRPVNSSSAMINDPGPSFYHTPTRQPLRRILSRAEMSKLSRSLDNDSGSLTPIHKMSPTRDRHRTSRFSLATSRISAPTRLVNANATTSYTHGKDNHKPSQTHSFKSSSSHTAAGFKVKSPSLDHRWWSKSATNLNDLNAEAERICNSLGTFRKRIASAVMDNLDAVTAEELERELRLTIRAVSERVRKNHAGSEILARDLDTYLANMIDERLDLRVKSKKDQIDATGTAEDHGEDQNRAVAGAKDESLEVA